MKWIANAQSGQLEIVKLYFPDCKYTQELPHYLPAADYLCHEAKQYITCVSKIPGEEEKCFCR